MSPGPVPRQAPEDGRAGLLLPAATAGAALLGAVLAARLFVADGFAQVVAIVVGVAIGIGAALWIAPVPGTRPDPAPRRTVARPSGPPSAARTPDAGPTRPPPAGARTSGTQADVARAVLPLLRAGDTPPGPAPWWTDGPRARTPRAPLHRPAAPDLTDYVASALVAQCPHCGGFRLDVVADRPGYAFGCGDCGMRWRWQPGTPWPAVVVRRGPPTGPSPHPADPD